MSNLESIKLLPSYSSALIGMKKMGWIADMFASFLSSVGKVTLPIFMNFQVKNICAKSKLIYTNGRGVKLKTLTPHWNEHEHWTAILILIYSISHLYHWYKLVYFSHKYF